MRKIRPYWKFIFQVLATIGAAVVAAMNTNNGVVTGAEWINVIIAALGAIGVLGAGNLPSGVWHYTKIIVAAFTTVFVYLASAITDTVTTQEWIQCGILFLGAFGVFQIRGPVVLTAGNKVGPRHAAPPDVL